jgi:hypothetical protein
MDFNNSREGNLNTTLTNKNNKKLNSREFRKMLNEEVIYNVYA